MALKQLIYVSQPFGFDAPMLNGILSDARRGNALTGVTGALICRADIYLQFLEGEAGAVEATFARIRTDDRHADVELLLEGAARTRRFAAWAMRDDPARSWMWTPKEVAAGAPRRAAPGELMAVFDRLAAEPPELAD
jgi:hypothetical protein